MNEYARQKEANYQAVVEALKVWKPSQAQRRFGVDTIREIVPNIGFLDAYDLKKRLQFEGKLLDEN